MAKQLVHKIKLSDSQFRAYSLLQSNTVTELLFGGGAGGGKSYLGCVWVLTSALSMPGSRGFIGRNELKRLKQTTLLTLFEVFRDNNLKIDRDYKFDAQMGVITLFNDPDPLNCSTIFLLDLAYAPSDPQYDRIGSTQFTYGFVDEAQEITRTCLEVLKARMRYKTAYFKVPGAILLTCNPSKNFLKTDFYDLWRKGQLPPNKAFVPSLYKDNIFGDPNYKKRLDDIADPVIRARLRDGNWDYEDDPNQLIPFSWFDNCFVKTIPIEGTKRIGVDVANEGSDKSVIAYWVADTLVDLYEIPISITENADISGEIAKEVIRYAKSKQVGYNNIIVDAVGVGAGVVHALRRKGWFVQSFKGGNTVVADKNQKKKNIVYVKDDDKFTEYANLRAYSHWIFRLGMQKQAIKIYEKVPHLEELKEELANQRFVVNEGNNEISIEKKSEIKKRIGRSPDFSDATIMGYYCPKPLTVDLSFI